MHEWIDWSRLIVSYRSSMMFFNLSLITLLMNIGVPCSTSPAAWSPVWQSSQETCHLNSPSMLELEASLGLLSLHHRLDVSIPLLMLPSPLNSSLTLVSASTPLSPSLRSSPSPPPCPYLPPHRHQVCGTRSSPTSSTPSLTLGDVNQLWLPLF